MSRSGPPGHTADDRATDRVTNSASSETEAYLLRVRGEVLAAGKRISLSGIRRLYSRWIVAPASRSGFLAFALDYADPTGETAARNVDRERVAA